MIPDLSKANIYIVCGHTDLREGIDGLAARLQKSTRWMCSTMHYSSFEASVRIVSRYLYWTKSGFLLLYKRFENGYMQWPRDRSDTFGV